jgi:cardiolipin synthase
MQLHRAKSQPEWASVAVAQQNQWQRLAAQTNGYLTPGNVITVLGLALCLAGLLLLLQPNYWAALVLVGVGRGFDLLDGWLAEATGTKSPLGEMMDATVDKIIGVAALFIFWIAAIAPGWVLLVLFLPQMVISVIATRAYYQQARLHPARLGKSSMALAWVCLLGFCLAKATTSDSAVIHGVLYAAAIVSGILGCLVIKDYLRDIRSARLSDGPSSRDS